jgi:hypothetical protein
MADISERHEIRVRGRDHTIVFLADSVDGRLVIRQERDGKKPSDVCAISPRAIELRLQRLGVLLPDEPKG